jgi:hypothetical protein
MRWITRNRWNLTVVLLLAGTGVLVWSWLARSDGWLSGALVNVGTTLLLFAPLLVVGRYIEKRLDDVQASQVKIELRQEVAAANIATLAEEVSQTQAELRRTHERLTETVVSRLAAARDKDRQVFADLEEAPSHDLLFAALVRAADLHLTTSTGCRVPVHNTHLFLWFETPTTHDQFQEAPDPAEDLYLRLERINGQTVAHLAWPRDQTAEDFLVALAEAVVRAGEYPGDRSFEAGRLFSDLRELLELAHESATSGSTAALSGVIQYCPPQWAITETALVSVGKPAGYSIPFSRIREPHWPSHMSGKSWLDRDSFDDAFEAGFALSEAKGFAATQTGPYDEPPF